MENAKELRALERRLACRLQSYLLENHLELAIALQEDHRLRITWKVKRTLSAN